MDIAAMRCEGHTRGFVGDGGYRHTGLSGMTYHFEGIQSVVRDRLPQPAPSSRRVASPSPNTWKPPSFEQVFGGQMRVKGIYHTMVTCDESIEQFNAKLYAATTYIGPTT